MQHMTPEAMLKTIADQQAEIIALKKLIAELTHVKRLIQWNPYSRGSEYFEHLSGNA